MKEAAGRDLDEEALTTRIQEAAKDYVANARTAEDGSRPSAVRRELKAIEDGAKRLFGALERASDYGLEALQNGGVHPLFKTKYEALKRRAAADFLPHHVGFHPPTDPESDDDDLDGEYDYWLPRLTALARLTQITRENMASPQEFGEFAIGLKGGPDKGGQRNLIRERWGHEKWHLAKDCFFILHEHGIKPTSTKDGVFRNLVAQVADYALAMNSEEKGQGWDHYVMLGTKICSEFVELSDQLQISSNRDQLTSEQIESLTAQLDRATMAMSTGQSPEE